MRTHRTDGIGEGQAGKVHGLPPRNTAISSARIETAFSAGERAPSFKPTGP
jgi:hypothetical protein